MESGPDTNLPMYVYVGLPVSALAALLVAGFLMARGADRSRRRPKRRRLDNEAAHADNAAEVSSTNNAVATATAGGVLMRLGAAGQGADSPSGGSPTLTHEMTVFHAGAGTSSAGDSPPGDSATTSFPTALPNFSSADPAFIAALEGTNTPDPSAPKASAEPGNTAAHSAHGRLGERRTSEPEFLAILAEIQHADINGVGAQPHHAHPTVHGHGHSHTHGLTFSCHGQPISSGALECTNGARPATTAVGQGTQPGCGVAGMVKHEHTHPLTRAEQQFLAPAPPPPSLFPLPPSWQLDPHQPFAELTPQAGSTNDAAGLEHYLSGSAHFSDEMPPIRVDGPRPEPFNFTPIGQSDFVCLSARTPWGVRVVSQTKSRKIPARNFLPPFV